MDAVQVRVARPDDDRVRPLLAELDAYLYRQYPPEDFGPEVNHILGVEALLHPSVTFCAAWRGDVAIGCGAVRRLQDGQGEYGEIKRMFVHPQARGGRVGQRLLEALEGALRGERIPLARLETGTRQPEALRLYERCGYVRRGPFGVYPDHPVSVFMEKPL